MNRDFLDLLKERDFLAQITHPEELREHIKEPRTAYLGIDPTAESLHIGNLVSLMLARRWQNCGHNIIILLGGATALIGDPSGKSEMRKMLSPEDIDARAKKIMEQVKRFIDFSDPKKARFVNNKDWLAPLSYIGFLRDFGIHFNVNRMLQAECFKLRMEQGGLSFLEFNYMIMQGYDFYELNRVYDCTLQFGGDDQWSNILAGMDLTRKASRKQAFCLTCPLLVSAEGKKMGKTEKGAVWLDESLTTPHELFQYFRNIADQDVGKLLRYFTDLEMSYVHKLENLKDAQINDAKVILAFEVCKLVHGVEKAEQAKAMATSLFGTNEGEKEAPEFIYELKSSTSLLDVLDQLGLSESKSHTRRLITQGGLQIGSQKIDNVNYFFAETARGQDFLIRLGKKRFYRICFK